MIESKTEQEASTRHDGNYVANWYCQSQLRRCHNRQREDTADMNREIWWRLSSTGTRKIRILVGKGLLGSTVRVEKVSRLRDKLIDPNAIALPHLAMPPNSSPQLEQLYVCPTFTSFPKLRHSRNHSLRRYSLISQIKPSMNGIFTGIAFIVTKVKIR